MPPELASPPPEKPGGQDDPPDLRQLLIVIARLLGQLEKRENVELARIMALRAVVRRVIANGGV